MSYIRNHWRGDCSLAQAFWINLVLVNLVLIALYRAPMVFGWIQYPVFHARWEVIGLAVLMGLVYPWQLVGLVRTSHRVWVDDGQRWAPVLVIALLMYGLIDQVQTLKRTWPHYQEQWSYGFKPDPLANHHITKLSSSNRIHVKGFLGFGLTRDIEEVVESFDDAESIDGVVLDSAGGRLYEARKLAEMIEQRQWNTYSTVGCYSACPLAFAAGSHRTLSADARIGFHQYNNPYTLETVPEGAEEYQRDSRYYRERGIKSDFVEKMFAVGPADMWRPTVNELQGAQFIHEVVPTGELLSDLDREVLYRPIRNELKTWTVFAEGARLKPEFFEHFVGLFWREQALGGPDYRLVDAIERRLDDWVMLFTDRAQDDDLRALLSTMADLMKTNPDQCLRMIFPDRYGGLNYRTVMGDNDWQQFRALLIRLVTDADETPDLMDNVTYQTVTSRLQFELGDDWQYINPGLMDPYQPADVCRAHRRWTEELLSMPDGKGLAFYRLMRANPR